MPVTIRPKQTTWKDWAAASVFAVVISVAFVLCQVYGVLISQPEILNLLVSIPIFALISIPIVWSLLRIRRMRIVIGRRSFFYVGQFRHRRVSLDRVTRIIWGTRGKPIRVETPDRRIKIFSLSAYDRNDGGRIVRWLRERFDSAIQIDWDLYYRGMYHPEKELTDRQRKDLIAAGRRQRSLRLGLPLFVGTTLLAATMGIASLVPLQVLGIELHEPELPAILRSTAVVLFLGGIGAWGMIHFSAEPETDRQKLLRRLPGPTALDWLLTFAPPLVAAPMTIRLGQGGILLVPIAVNFIFLACVFWCAQTQTRLMEEIEAQQFLPRAMRRPVPSELEKYESIAERLSAGQGNDEEASP